MTFSTSKDSRSPSPKPFLVVLTGAEISAESGIPTFRDSGGIWGEYDLMEVGTSESWLYHPEKVLDFTNDVKLRFRDARPNPGHILLAELKKCYEVIIITQNIDTLHEEGVSSRVIHVHGRIDQGRSTPDDSLIYDWPKEKLLEVGDLCERGSQLRPYTVLFGEEVLDIELADDYMNQADLLLVIGTSLRVFPAAGLVLSVPAESPKYLIAPAPMVKRDCFPRLEIIEAEASQGMELLLPVLSRD